MHSYICIPTYCIPTSLHSYIIASLYHSIPILLHPYIIASLYYCIPTLLHLYIIASLYHCIPISMLSTLLHPYIILYCFVIALCLPHHLSHFDFMMLLALDCFVPSLAQSV